MDLFEIFNPLTGNTWVFLYGEERAKEYCKTSALDYMPAASGYYVKRDDKLTGLRFNTMAEAQRYCDFENMGSDYSTLTAFYYQASVAGTRWREALEGKG